MGILFLGGHPPADMALRLIHIQHLSGLRCQRTVDLRQAFCHIFMYRTLTDPEFFRRLANGCILLHNVISYLQSPFFNITFHRQIPCNTCFYIVCRGFLKIHLHCGYFPNFRKRKRLIFPSPQQTWLFFARSMSASVEFPKGLYYTCNWFADMPKAGGTWR